MRRLRMAKMSDPWTAIGTLVGGGGTLGLIAALLVFVTRNAIATAVTQAGNRELERLRGELNRSLETYKHELQQERERERDAAAHILEQFKAELSLGAEVRRHVAARKVD